MLNLMKRCTSTVWEFFGLTELVDVLKKNKEVMHVCGLCEAFIAHDMSTSETYDETR